MQFIERRSFPSSLNHFETIPSRPVPTLQISPRTEPVFVVEQWVNKRFAGRARHGIQQLAIPVIDGW
jgi:hypothetical protein